MFTGIIEGLGTITAIRPSGQGKHLSLNTDFDIRETQIGDSIAVNGACLTVVQIGEKRFEADLSGETLKKTTFGKAKTGDRVNLERAMRLSDRMDGHLVLGHVDGVGEILDRKTAGESIAISVRVPEYLSRYMISKGSVAVDGISLTVNICRKDRFDVYIIPHTAKVTTLAFKKVGDPVNIETDMIGKYVEKFMAQRGNIVRETEKTEPVSGIDMKFLTETGFL
jgi:riboflavin synthase